MAATKIPVITREYFRIPVTLTVDGLPIDPTGLTVEWAVVAQNTTPASGDWKAGTWETVHNPDLAYLARTLVGDATTDFPLTQGNVYDAWMRITDNPERPARLVGQIQAI